MASVVSRKALQAVRTLCLKDIRLQPRPFCTSQCRNMKLLQFTYPDKPEELHVGYMDGDKIVDVNKIDPSVPNTVIGVLKSGSLNKVKQLATQKQDAVNASTVRLAAPVSGMDKVLCIGLNYRDHCEEQKLSPPEVPMFFSKFSSTVIGPNDPVRLRTDVTKCVDFEVELVVVIGRTASRVKASEALDYVAGYTVSQDISARDWQKTKNAGQFLLGKSMDTFCPIGPYIVTTDEIKDPQVLDIQCSVNGVVKQKSNTCQLVHKIPDALERLTKVMTLYPGDILLTGTPGGVGMYRDPPEYLRPGDVVESTIQNIGTLVTKVEEF